MRKVVVFIQTPGTYYWMLQTVVEHGTGNCKYLMCTANTAIRAIPLIIAFIFILVLKT